MRHPKMISREKFWFYLALVTAATVFYVMTVANHYFFRTAAFDYGLYNFAFWDNSHFHISPCPVYRVVLGDQPSLMQDHLSFALFFLTPLYWLLNWITGSYTLFLIQTTFILWSGWAVYRLILLKTNDAWMALASFVYYFLLSARYCAFESDFNMAVFCACFVPLFLYYFESRRFTAAVAFFIFALFSREDMSLWFLFIFIVLMIWNWKEKKVLRICLWLMLACVVYFIILFKVFIPFFETPSHPYALFQYRALGANPLEALKFIFQHPWNTFKMLFQNHLPDQNLDHIKYEFYLVYLVSGGFVLFFRPQYFIWFIPLIAQKMLNDEYVRWSILWSYAVMVATVLPISVFLILSKIRSRPFKYSAAILVCVLALGVTDFKMNRRNRIQAMDWNPNVKENMFDTHFFKANFDAGRVHKDLRLIPDNARVSASASLVAHLAQRKKIYHFPDVGDAEYIAAFTFPDYYLMPTGQYNAEVYSYFFSPDWNLIANDAPFFLFKKEPNCQKRFMPRDSIVCDVEMLSPDRRNIITSDGQRLIPLDNRDTSRPYRGKYSVKADSKLPYALMLDDKKVRAGDLLRISVWRHTDNANSGALIVEYNKDPDQTLRCAYGINKDSLGWDQLQVYVTVPEKHEDF